MRPKCQIRLYLNHIFLVLFSKGKLAIIKGVLSKMLLTAVHFDDNIKGIKQGETLMVG